MPLNLGTYKPNLGTGDSKKMKINANAWHCRIYLWWYKKKYGCTNERGHSNLCPYMRAVMLWAPLRFLFTDAVSFGKIPLGALTIPALMIACPLVVGYFNYYVKRSIWGIYCVIAAASFCTALVLVIVYLRVGEEYDLLDKVEKIAGGSFAQLLKAYFRSAHDRVCPEIDWIIAQKGGAK